MIRPPKRQNAKQIIAENSVTCLKLYLGTYERVVLSFCAVLTRLERALWHCTLLVTKNLSCLSLLPIRTFGTFPWLN